MTSGRQSWVIASRSLSRASAGVPNSATTPSIIFWSSDRSGSDHTASCVDHASVHVGPTARTSSPRLASGPSRSGPVATRTSFPARSAARINGSIGSTCPYAGHDVNLALGNDRPAYLVGDLVGDDRFHEVRASTWRRGDGAGLGSRPRGAGPRPPCRCHPRCAGRRRTRGSPGPAARRTTWRCCGGRSCRRRSSRAGRPRSANRCPRTSGTASGRRHRTGPPPPRGWVTTEDPLTDQRSSDPPPPQPARTSTTSMAIAGRIIRP